MVNKAGNRSHAVIARRHDSLSSLDDFPTPPWATRALFEEVIYRSKEGMKLETCLEPACNRGHMSNVLKEYFKSVTSFDVHDYGYGDVCDFIGEYEYSERHDWIITNPPFKLAEEFITTAIEEAFMGVAMLVRTSFSEGIGRYDRLFSKMPPTYIAQFSERVPMVKGRYDPKASTATSYCWMVWMQDSTKWDHKKTEFVWIPPCRKKLERPEDFSEFTQG